MTLPGCCMGHLAGRCLGSRVPLYIAPNGDVKTWRVRCVLCGGQGYQFTRLDVAYAHSRTRQQAAEDRETRPALLAEG